MRAGALFKQNKKFFSVVINSEEEK